MQDVLAIKMRVPNDVPGENNQVKDLNRGALEALRGVFWPSKWGPTLGCGRSPLRDVLAIKMGLPKVDLERTIKVLKWGRI